MLVVNIIIIVDTRAQVAMLKRAGITVEDRPGWQNETSTRLFSSEVSLRPKSAPLDAGLTFTFISDA